MDEVDVVVVDVQLFSAVEDEGFRTFVTVLDLTYALPGRKAVKSMVEAKHKEKATAEEQASAVTSINTDAYLAVTSHYLTSEVGHCTFGGETVPKDTLQLTLLRPVSE
ncbi:hypothetical protein LDENG_00156650 [Lucifuga dentata]|nr:hypothetical protein LDENG_00156650 [Lucifuga dentata]